MNKLADPDIEKFRALLREVNSLKAPLSEGKGPPPSSILQGFFTCIDNLLKPRLDKLDRNERRKLSGLLQKCQSADEPTEALHRAAMEIGEIAPLGDTHSLDALSALLSHENKHVRINACMSLGRIGGEKAREALEPMLGEQDPDIRRCANEALYICKMVSLSQNIRKFMEELPALRAEKRDLVTLLSDKYSTQTLFLCSGGFLLSFLATLVAWYSFNVLLIHPAISIVGAGASASFMFLSAWRRKCK